MQIKDIFVTKLGFDRLVCSYYPIRNLVFVLSRLYTNPKAIFVYNFNLLNILKNGRINRGNLFVFL